MTLFALVLVATLITTVRPSPLVNVSFYSEALCPFTDDFTEGEMNEAVEKVGQIFTLHFVPWGNAKMNADGSFSCQHGEIECTMNTIEACVIHYNQQRSTWWPFIVCLEAHGYKQTYDIAEKCATENNITWAEVKTCADGQMGKSLEIMYYKETASLDPPHTYTPWVTINGKHVQETNMVKKICKAYEGTNKPEACSHTQKRFAMAGSCYK